MLAFNSCDMNMLELPEEYNYIAVFLTLGCNLRCPFCINRYGEAGGRYPMMSGDRWLAGLNRIVSRPGLPITVQGGEPSLHPDFCRIITGLRSDLSIDILTNLQFDVDAFMASVPAERVRRDAPYASIRVSYHPGEMQLDATVAKVARMLERGYSVGVWAVDHPAHGQAIDEARQVCTAQGIDFRLKAFLGEHEGRLYGDYKYPDGLSRREHPPVVCRTTELIVGPSGGVFRCHGDLYEGRPAIGLLYDDDFTIDTGFRPCTSFGFCNPCDVKIKTNRFQQFGHTSVEIRRAGETAT